MFNTRAKVRTSTHDAAEQEATMMLRSLQKLSAAQVLKNVTCPSRVSSRGPGRGTHGSDGTSRALSEAKAQCKLLIGASSRQLG
jgi:hypothetical protein